MKLLELFVLIGTMVAASAVKSGGGSLKMSGTLARTGNCTLLVSGVVDVNWDFEDKTIQQI